MKSAQEENSDRYQSISAPAEGLYKDKGSRFIAYAYPVSSEDEVKPFVDALKKEHHAAKHHCFAYRLGWDGALFRANDDGEPSGTAGRQILGTIDSMGLKDVLVVVVRYFGGVLLGVPGLIKAYREASASALGNAVKVEKTACETMVLEFGWPEMETVQKLLKGGNVEVVEQKFDISCVMRIRLRLSQKDEFLDKLKNVNNEKSTRIQCRPLQTAPACD